MGSFNETCALSNLNISPGTKVKLLFLTQNPYVVSDGHEAQRGCYHYDQWLVRTPPISGVYADYGECEFEENSISELICECFKQDVLERPFGFNQFHTCDVTKSKGIRHFLQAAWQGRLLVRDDYIPLEKPPAEIPTWERVQALMKKAGLPIQSESKKAEGGKAFNAQPVLRGIVCVTFNDYGDTAKELHRAEKALTKEYDCRIVYKFDDKRPVCGQPCLMVVPRGAFENPQLLFDPSISTAMFTHPGRINKPRQQPVLAVMVHEEVWSAYCKIEPKSVSGFLEKLKDVTTRKESSIIGLKPGCYSEIEFRETLLMLPFQTTVSTHLCTLLRKGMPVTDEILQACAEVACVDSVMERIHQSWYIPCLGGQDGSWELRTKLLSKITAISRKELEKENELMNE